MVINGLAIVNNDRFLEKCEFLLWWRGERSAAQERPRRNGSHTPTSFIPPLPLPPCLPHHTDGWGYSQLARGGGVPHPSADFGGGGGPSAGVLARQVIEFLHAVTYLRVPLIPLNAAVILVKLVFG